MPYRPPTYEEIAKRVRAVRFWIAGAMYALIGFGGALLFTRWVRDAGWQDIFFSVWWLPSFFAAAWGSALATDWIVAWVKEESPPSS